MPQMTDKLKGYSPNSYNSPPPPPKKKIIDGGGGVFNILLNTLRLTGITLDRLGLVFNRS